MRRISLVWLMLLTPGAVLATPEQHRYLETTGVHSTLFDWTLEQRADGIHIAASQTGSRFLTRCNDTGATLSWQLNDTQRDIQALRDGNRLLLRGIRDNRPYTDAFTLDADPWFQALSYSLRIWLYTAATHTTFWTLRPDTLEAVKLRASRVGIETLQTPAGPIPAVHVRVRPEGLLAPLWKSDYWFRRNDLLFVRYEAVNGLPGTAGTTIELLPELHHADPAPPAPGDL